MCYHVVIASNDKISTFTRLHHTHTHEKRYFPQKYGWLNLPTVIKRNQIEKKFNKKKYSTIVRRCKIVRRGKKIIKFVFLVKCYLVFAEIQYEYDSEQHKFHSSIKKGIEWIFLIFGFFTNRGKASAVSSSFIIIFVKTIEFNIKV